MNQPRVQLEIEKLVYGGDGLARLPADEKGRRMAALIPFTLPGEQIEAEIISRKGGLARGEARSWVKRSPQRVEPACPYFGACGGCHLQHGSYELQVAAKRDILRETFSRAGVGEIPETETLTSEPWAYRNRIRLQVRPAPQWQLGYLQRRTHKFLPVQACPIAAPLLQRAIGALQSPQISALAPAGISEMEIFCNHDESQLLLTAWRADAVLGGRPLQPWLDACRVRLPELCPETHLAYRVAGEEYRVAAGAFFQANLHLLDALAQRLTSAVPGPIPGDIFDLYAGVGLFAKLLARRGARVTAVESSPASSADLKHNLREFPSAQAMPVSVERFLSQTSLRPGAVVVDPPRAGLGDKVARQLARIAAPALVYLSCDPATLARDIKLLLGCEYTLTSLQMIDMFPQTFHIEALAVLRHN